MLTDLLLLLPTSAPLRKPRRKKIKTTAKHRKARMIYSREQLVARGVFTPSQQQQGQGGAVRNAANASPPSAAGSSPPPASAAAAAVASRSHLTAAATAAEDSGGGSQAPEEEQDLTTLPEGALLSGARDPSIQALKGGRLHSAGERKASYKSAEQHLEEINKKLDRIDLEVSYVSPCCFLCLFLEGEERKGGSGRACSLSLAFSFSLLLSLLLSPPSFCRRRRQPPLTHTLRRPLLCLCPTQPRPPQKNPPSRPQRYNALHQEKVQVLHARARILAEIIWTANDPTTLVVNDGKATRSPRAWLEVMELTCTKSPAAAARAAGELIAGSVGWRLCLQARASILEEFSAGDFYMQQFCRAARKVGVFSYFLFFSAASGHRGRDGARLAIFFPLLTKPPLSLSTSHHHKTAKPKPTTAHRPPPRGDAERGHDAGRGTHLQEARAL